MKIFIKDADQHTSGYVVLELCEFYNGDFCVEIEDSTDLISVKASKLEELIAGLQRMHNAYTKKLLQRVKEFPDVRT
jgi:hypothetical protein